MRSKFGEELYTQLQASKYFWVVAILLLFMPSVLSIYWLYLLQTHQDLWQPYFWESAILFHVVSIFTMAFGLMPTSVVALLSGYFFRWYGLPMLLLCYPISALLGLSFSRKLYNYLQPQFWTTPSQQALRQRIEARQLEMLFYMRLSPALPFAFSNFLLSALHLHFLPFLVGTMLGMLPRTLLLFYTGMQAKEVWEFAQHPTVEKSLGLAPLFFLIVSSIGLFFLGRKINS